MQTPFSFFQRERQAVSPGTINALIHLQRQELLTGLVEASYPEDEQALLFFNLGIPFALYYLADGIWRKIPTAHWNDIFSLSEGEASALPLGGDSLRLLLVALESGSVPVEELTLRPAGLPALIAEEKADKTATLLRVWDDAFQALFILPGRNVPVQDALVFSREGVLTESKALAYFSASQDRLIRASQIKIPDTPKIMDEYALRVAFLAITQSMLARFDELAGDTLTAMLGREVNSYADHQGWNIQFFGDRVSHRQFFQELAEATIVYRSLYRIIKNYVQRVVGGTLATNILNDGVRLLPENYREIFERQNFIVG